MNNNYNDAQKERLNARIETMRFVMAEKAQSLSLVSGLSATLLVVATFNGELLEMTFWVKVLISIFLLWIQKVIH